VANRKGIEGGEVFIGETDIGANAMGEMRPKPLAWVEP
jgi:hypothetical protein